MNTNKTMKQELRPNSCDNVADFFCKLITVLQAHESELGDIEFSIDGDHRSVDLYLGSKQFNCQIVLTDSMVEPYSEA